MPDKMSGTSYQNDPDCVHGRNPHVCVQCHIILLKHRIAELESGIRKHRDAKGHNLCWENDHELWSLLNEPIPHDRQVPPWPEFMTKCAEYRASLEPRRETQ